MNWWSKRKKDSAGTYSKISSSNGKRTNGFGKTEEIPQMVLDGLKSKSEGKVIMRIGTLGSDNNYDKTDVCEHLIGFVQSDGRDNVVKAASETLVGVLKNMYNTDTVIFMIKQGLFAKNEKNAEFFVSLLDETGCSVELRKCAVEMLAGFTEEDISSETMDRMEATLFERHEDPKENGEVRNLIGYRFGPNRDGRPKVMTDEEKGDETVAMEPGKTHEKETEALDVFSGWIEMLKHPDEKRREIAAKSLISIIGQTSDRKKIERVIDAFQKGGSEFVSHVRKVRGILNKMGPESDALHKRSTLPRGPNGPIGNSNEPTKKQTLKR